MFYDEGVLATPTHNIHFISGLEEDTHTQQKHRSLSEEAQNDDTQQTTKTTTTDW